MSKLVSIIIPCHNEESNVEDIYGEFISLLNFEFEYEFIYVNDGSTDKTIVKIMAMANKDERVKVIDFSRNFGKEAAILAGLDSAMGDAAIIIDADLQMPVNMINTLVELWNEGSKLVITYKTGRTKGLKSKLASKYYNVFNKLSDSKILNDALDFQIMDREVIDTICSMRERTRFFKGITGYIGYDYKIIPVDIVERKSGKSDFASTKTLFSYAFKSMALYSDVPLKIALFLGVGTAFLSFIYLVYVVIKTIIYGVAVDGYASTIVIMMFLFSTVLLILGVMGYYIALIYNEVKQRPNYIIKDKKNIGDK